MKVQELFDLTAETDCTGYRKLWFNVYEDTDAFTMEAAFDEETFVIGRDDPAVVADKNTHWETVLSEVQTLVEDFCQKNTAKFSHLSEIAYGFVDGELEYLRQDETPSPEYTERFTAEDFADFKIVKLHAWISVYVDREVQKQLPLPLFPPMDPTEEELQKYREFLAEHMDYEKYNSMK